MTRLLLLGSALLLAAPDAGTGAPEATGVRSAEAWLRLIDEGRYGSAWDESAAMFRERVSRAQWETMSAAARGPLGRVLSRKLGSAQLVHELPGAPDGTYLVLVYQTRFEHKERGIETVTVMLDSAGSFRGAGYFIR